MAAHAAKMAGMRVTLTFTESIGRYGYLTSLTKTLRSQTNARVVLDVCHAI